jgi:ubiquinone/menaquinone biosynthesis C-methylase UbiE
MYKNILDELHRDLRSESPSLLDFTRKAFQILPPMDHPRILDIGCGEGEPTLELARLSKGEIIGMDINQSSLDKLSTKMKRAGFSERAQVVNHSMFDMDFPEENFDVIWSEGSIQFIGFERGLREWRKFIKPEGFLAIHEMAWLRPNPPQEIVERWQNVYPDIKTLAEYIEQIPTWGYSLLDAFTLPEDTWWYEYYYPLETRIRNLRKKYVQDLEAQKMLDQEQRDVDLYKKYSKWYGSAFMVMQKSTTICTKTGL